MRRWISVLTLALTLSVAQSVHADETITVSSTSSEIASGLDLKAVAKIFASSKNLEEFEALLNNPDSSYVNLDLNGDGDIDYIRIVETGSGNNHLIVLQAVLAKDIFQDVASIQVVKDETKNDVRVTITGDERLYGKNYVITPVYIYRPVIYDWFWGPDWYCWNSPYYWGYWPVWWHAVPCWGVAWYSHHIYAYHHAHPYCSYRATQEVRNASRVAGPTAVAATRSADTRTQYAMQSSYMPNRTATSATRVPASTQTASSSRGQTSARYATYTNSTRSASTRSANTTSTPSRSATYTNTNTNTNPSRSSYTSTRSASYSGGSYGGSTRSAGSYSGSSRSAGGYSGQSVRR